MKTAARTVYFFFGTLAIGLSLIALLKPGLVLSPEADSPLTAHLVQEQGAAGMVVGLMAFWCLANFKTRRPVHLALLLFAMLFSAIHWNEYMHSRRQLLSPLINSLPFLMLLVATPLGRTPEPRGLEP